MDDVCSILEMIAQNEVSEWGKGVGVTSHPTPLIAPAPALVISARSHQSMGAQGGGQRGEGHRAINRNKLIKECDQRDLMQRNADSTAPW